jgi:hypothetical protein
VTEVCKQYEIISDCSLHHLFIYVEPKFNLYNLMLLKYAILVAILIYAYDILIISSNTRYLIIQNICKVLTSVCSCESISKLRKIKVIYS